MGVAVCERGVRMKRYKVVGFEDAGTVFCFTGTAENVREALRAIEKDYYMTDMDFCKLEITEVENDYNTNNTCRSF